MSNASKLKEAISTEAGRLGFAACGFTRADATADAGLELQRWLAAGHHGTMGWMEQRAAQRVSPLSSTNTERAAASPWSWPINHAVG